MRRRDELVGRRVHRLDSSVGNLHVIRRAEYASGGHDLLLGPGAVPRVHGGAPVAERRPVSDLRPRQSVLARPCWPLAVLEAAPAASEIPSFYYVHRIGNKSYRDRTSGGPEGLQNSAPELECGPYASTGKTANVIRAMASET